VVLPSAFAPKIPKTSPLCTCPASIVTEKVEYFFSRVGYFIIVSPVNCPTVVETSKENFLSRNRTFSFGRYPSRNTLIPTFVDNTPDTIHTQKKLRIVPQLNHLRNLTTLDHVPPPLHSFQS